MATMKQEGRRVWVKTQFGEPVVARLKALGAKWDPDTKQWWLGSGKLTQVQQAIQEAQQAPVQTPEKEDPDKIRLVGKAKYKGRTYYVRWVGDTRKGYSARLVTLDQSLDFWAQCAQPHETQHDGSGDVAVMVKTYSPREIGYGKWARTEYTTLGSIKDFITRQKNPDTARGACSECGAWGPVGVLCGECSEGYH